MLLFAKSAQHSSSLVLQLAVLSLIPYTCMLTPQELHDQTISLVAARIKHRIYEIEGRHPAPGEMLEHGEFLYRADELRLKWRGEVIFHMTNGKA